MPRKAFTRTDPVVRADALKRHALTRRIERRERWLEKSGVTPELLKEAVATLQAGMRATKLIPSVTDRKGNVIGERIEVPDHAVRVKAASEVADFVRLVTGLTAETKGEKPAEVQTTLVISVPDWLRPQPAQIAAPRADDAPIESVEAEPVVRERGPE